MVIRGLLLSLPLLLVMPVASAEVQENPFEAQAIVPNPPVLSTFSEMVILMVVQMACSEKDLEPASRTFIQFDMLGLDVPGIQSLGPLPRQIEVEMEAASCTDSGYREEAQSELVLSAGDPTAFPGFLNITGAVNITVTKQSATGAVTYGPESVPFHFVTDAYPAADWRTVEQPDRVRPGQMFQVLAEIENRGNVPAYVRLSPSSMRAESSETGGNPVESIVPLEIPSPILLLSKFQAVGPQDTKATLVLNFTAPVNSEGAVFYPLIAIADGVGPHGLVSEQGPPSYGVIRVASSVTDGVTPGPALGVILLMALVGGVLSSRRHHRMGL